MLSTVTPPLSNQTTGSSLSMAVRLIQPDIEDRIARVTTFR